MIEIIDNSRDRDAQLALPGAQLALLGNFALRGGWISFRGPSAENRENLGGRAGGREICLREPSATVGFRLRGHDKKKNLPSGGFNEFERKSPKK